jgi:DNA uptake protein ComE-like DNA-binding protein
LEDEAKREKIGAWGVGAGRLNAHAQPSSAFNSFVADGKTPLRSERPDASTVFPVPKPAALMTRSPVTTNGSHTKEETPLGRIDVNTATEKELTTVPGIGHVIAAHIVAARPFRSADDLEKVSGIGDKKYAQIRPFFQ